MKAGKESLLLTNTDCFPRADECEHVVCAAYTRAVRSRPNRSAKRVSTATYFRVSDWLTLR